MSTSDIKSGWSVGSPPRMSISLISSPARISASFPKSESPVSGIGDNPRLKQKVQDSLHLNVGKNCMYKLLLFFCDDVVGPAKCGRYRREPDSAREQDDGMINLIRFCAKFE